MLQMNPEGRSKVYKNAENIFKQLRQIAEHKLSTLPE